MHILLGIPIVIGIIYILTMTQFGRWLSLACLLIIGAVIGGLFASGMVGYHTAPQYQVASAKVQPVDHNCDMVINDLGKDLDDPQVEEGKRIFIGIVCPTRPEGVSPYK